MACLCKRSNWNGMFILKVKLTWHIYTKGYSIFKSALGEDLNSFGVPTTTIQFCYPPPPYLCILNSILHLETPCATPSSHILFKTPYPHITNNFQVTPGVTFENGIALKVKLTWHVHIIDPTNYWDSLVTMIGTIEQHKMLLHCVSLCLVTMTTIATLTRHNDITIQWPFMTFWRQIMITSGSQ